MIANIELNWRLKLKRSLIRNRLVLSTIQSPIIIYIKYLYSLYYYLLIPHFRGLNTFRVYENSFQKGLVVLWLHETNIEINKRKRQADNHLAASLTILKL